MLSENVCLVSSRVADICQLDEMEFLFFFTYSCVWPIVHIRTPFGGGGGGSEIVTSRVCSLWYSCIEESGVTGMKKGEPVTSELGQQAVQSLAVVNVLGPAVSNRCTDIL